MGLPLTYMPFLIPHSERLTEKHSNSLWAQTLSCGIHTAPVVILSIFVLATLVKSSVGAFIKDSTKSFGEKKSKCVLFCY